MKSHTDRGPDELPATSHQHRGHGGPWRRLLSKRSLGLMVALSVPGLGLGLAACGGTSGSAAAATPATTPAQAGGPSGFAGHAGPVPAERTGR